MLTKFLGVSFFVLGVLWLFNNLGITTISIGELISTYWPVILIVWGLDILVQKARKRKYGEVISGLVLLVLGILVLGRNVGIYEMDFTVLWKLILPLFIIFVGWSLLKNKASSSGGTHFAVMSGIELKNRGWKLENGNFFAFMGGVKMDLTAAAIPDEEIRLGLTAIMGGIEIKVPTDLAVECEGTALLGGLNFLGEESGGIFTSRRLTHEKATGINKKLYIRGSVIMGGISVIHSF